MSASKNLKWELVLLSVMIWMPLCLAQSVHNLSSTVYPSPTPVFSECTNYQILSDESRSINYTSNSVQCDSGLSGWYRFMGPAGDRMIDYPIHQQNGGPYRCGTHRVGWLTSNHPSPRDGRVQRTVCFSWDGRTCDLSTQIMVTNCGEFYVYRIHGTTGCTDRYCGTGKENFCGLTLTSSVGTVTSPHFPEMYQNNLSCYTEIVAPSDKRIALTIQEYDIENCCDNLQMYDRINGSDHLAAQLSGWSRQVKSLYSYSNEIKLVFKTDGSGVGKGFFASYRFFNSTWIGSQLNSSSGSIINPLIPWSYPKDWNATIKIVAPLDKQIVLTIHNYTVKHGYRILQIYDILPSSDQLIAQLNDSQSHSQTFYSTVNILTLLFLSNETRMVDGFYASYEAKYVVCHRPMTANSGFFASPNFPLSYPNNMRCTMRIIAPLNKLINLTIHEYEMESCCDYLQINDIKSGSSHMLAQLTGSSTNVKILYSTGNEFQLYFYTDYSVIQKGFRASYTFLDAAVSKINACKYYQTITDIGSTKCDNALDGWYRFTGNAGTRMVTSCPYGNSGNRRCNVHWQGWLMDLHPNVNDGEVYKTVCFSKQGSCSCDHYKAIKVKNCGYFYVYRFDGVPTCDATYCGVKENTVQVSCSDNYMRVDLSRQFYNASKYSSITLRDTSCSASISSSFITLGSVPGLCGAVRKETANHIIYQNQVIMKEKQDSGIVSRDHDLEVDVSCKYDRDGIASGASFKPISKIQVNETGIGSFTFYFEMFTSKLYSSQYSSYPAKVQLRDNLYFQARASVQDNGLVLLIDQCYSTPTMDRNHYQKYMFINNGCPLDKTVQFHSTIGQQQRFSIQAFRYLNNQSTVFIHCLVLICQKSSRDYRCTSGCAGNNVNRVKRDLSGGLTFANEEGLHSKYYLLEAGPVVLDDGKGSSRKQGSDSSGKALMTTVIALVVGVAALAVVVAFLLIRMRRNANKAPPATDNIGIDNAPNGKVYANDDENVGKGESVF